MKKKGRIGSSFDDFLKQEGIYEEVAACAIKRVKARQRDASHSQRPRRSLAPLKTDKTPPECPP
jgi:hypothetical protein